MTSDTATTLQDQPLLQSLPQSVMAQLSSLPMHELPNGTKVFETRSDCGGFPVILSGMVRVFKHLANGRRIELYRVTPSEPCILSLGCLLGGGQYPASGITSGVTRMVVMPSELFNRCLGDDAAFRTAIFRALGDRLVNTMELVEEVATLRLDVRLAAALIEHDRAASEHGGSTISVTHQDLADELGTVREMISRLLDDFARQGVVVLGRARIELIDREKLRMLAHAR